VRYGFVIDQRRCIGCHACTVACKEENQVPLGAFRTWVKYVERGSFPHTRRYFAVLRCNHCDHAPCVTICPTVALYRRPDGIVDLDGERCIGCKSCMQACPYDALYIDPGTGTAAKCHYCAHRTEVGLEPACVVVCPEQAIIAGDLDEPTSRIARLVATEQVQVRKPEQGTHPKVFYLGADSGALTPTLQTAAESYMWAQRPAEERELVSMVAALQESAGGDAALVRPVYDVPHRPRPWGRKVSTYLWTKSIAAGVPVAALVAADTPLGSLIPPLISLVFLALTTLLLVIDLQRPERFHYILLKPNLRSWLVWGAWILIAFGLVGAIELLLALVGRAGPAWLNVVWALLAVATAAYSAFLFGQAEGRDFWQSPLKSVHLVVAAGVAGSAALLLAAPGWERPPALLSSEQGVTVTVEYAFSPAWSLSTFIVLAIVGHGALVLAEICGRHADQDAALAARLLTRGPLRREFWGGAIGLGVLVPAITAVAAAMWGSVPFVVGAAVLALAGLWLYEDLWVRAGQAVPLS
jgi:Fe-S-cluster-containing dehydrogenase component/formate-dependent nitrite reductase membrane component NrfD